MQIATSKPADKCYNVKNAPTNFFFPQIQFLPNRTIK